MLKITSEGGKAALDLRLMKPSADDPQNPKSIRRSKHFPHLAGVETGAFRAACLCDLSTPKTKGFLGLS